MRDKRIGVKHGCGALHAYHHLVAGGVPTNIQMRTRSDEWSLKREALPPAVMEGGEKAECARTLK